MALPGSAKHLSCQTTDLSGTHLKETINSVKSPIIQLDEFWKKEKGKKEKKGWVGRGSGRRKNKRDKVKGILEYETRENSFELHLQSAVINTIIRVMNI